MTDVGKVRHNNEDSIFVSNEPVGALPNLYIVSDGMGGHNAGEVASQKGIAFFRDYIEHMASMDGDVDIMEELARGASYANEKVFEISMTDHAFSGMGATFSLCVLDRGKLYAAHIGDSRIYLIKKDGGIERLSTDHTYVNEMVKAGEITENEARSHPQRHLITRALGTEETLKIDRIVKDVSSGDFALICSDGLSNMVQDDMISGIICESSGLNEKCERLLGLANENGGEDNISVVLIEVSEVSV
jgi:protein phosphatase